MAILRDNWIIVAIAVAVVAALVVLIWLWWRVPKWQMQDRIFKSEKERADAEDNFRKTLGQALGGAAVLIGAGAAYLQFLQQQQTATQQIIAQQKIASDQIGAQQQVSEVSRKASEDLLISNQVSKGFEQLASDKVPMRLGGIYALEGVMNASAQYYQPLLEALCAFVRDGTVGKTGERGPANDIQAVLTVIGRRNSGGNVDLRFANLRAADLQGANLSGANLFQANLTFAALAACRSDVSDCRPFAPITEIWDLGACARFRTGNPAGWLANAVPLIRRGWASGNGWTLQFCELASVCAGQDEHPLHVPGHGHEVPLTAHIVDPT